LKPYSRAHSPAPTRRELPDVEDDDEIYSNDVLPVTENTDLTRTPEVSSASEHDSDTEDALFSTSESDLNVEDDIFYHSGGESTGESSINVTPLRQLAPPQTQRPPPAGSPGSSKQPGYMRSFFDNLLGARKRDKGEVQEEDEIDIEDTASPPPASSLAAKGAVAAESSSTSPRETGKRERKPPVRLQYERHVPKKRLPPGNKK
jgi:hypothetical protein